MDQPVGCDLMLGSTAKEDVCRECGGDNSTCNSVSGVYDQNNFQTGASFAATDFFVLTLGH